MARPIRDVSLLVAGGRTMELGPIGWTVLDSVRAGAADAGEGIAVVIHGAADGADASAGRWAARRGVAVDEHPARWRLPDGSIDKTAGVRRSAEMVAMDPDLSVIFPGNAGTDRTAEMLVRAGKKRVLDLRRMTAVRPMAHADVRAQISSKWSRWADYQRQHVGFGVGVAQLGAFQGDALPGHAVWVGDGPRLGRSRIAMPCVDRRVLEPMQALEEVRRLWKSENSMREIVATGEVFGGLLVCSCGSRTCLAPVLGTVMTHMRCRQAMAGAGLEVPDERESARSLVEWSRLGMIAAASAWSRA